MLFFSDQTQRLELLCNAVLVYRGSNAVAPLFQVFGAIGHAHTDADNIGHLQVIIAVTKADGICQRAAQMVTDCLDAGALIKFAVDELTIHKAIGQAVQLAFAVACGVDILAVQGTGALRPDGSTSAQFIRAIKAKYPDQLVMADCDNFENAMACAEAGADFVGTTMRGYTPETTGIDDIDFDFVHKLAAECPAKVIAEGHIHYPEQAVKALEAGAFALVVGGAITRPAEITARFTGAINAAKK